MLRVFVTKGGVDDDRQSQMSFSMQGATATTPATPQTPGCAGDNENASKPDSGNQAKQQKRKCRLCKTMQPVSEWPINCPHCRFCKRAIDNLAYCAKIQKQDDWWKQVRKDEAELRSVVKKYLEQCPAVSEDGAGGSKKRGVFNTVRYQEEFRATSAIINDDEGIMMHRSRYLAWAQSPANPEGILNKTQAEIKWDEMADAAGQGKWLTNNHGPPSEPVQLRIKVADRVTFRNAFEHSKVQEIQQNKEVKKATLESVEAGTRSLLRDHEKGLGRDGKQKDFGAIAQAMLAASEFDAGGGLERSSAFAGPGVFMPNIENMKDEIDDAKQEELQKKEEKKAAATLAREGHSASGINTTPTTTPKPFVSGDSSTTKEGNANTEWFDEGSINKAKRMQEQSQTKMTETLEKTLATALESLHADNSSKDPSIACRERDTLKARLKFLIAVMGWDPAETDALITNPTTETVHRMPQLKEECQQAALKTIQDGVAAGRPPCVDYLLLEPTSLMAKALSDGFADLLKNANSKDEVLLFCKAMDGRRQPLLKLCKSVSSAARELSSAHNSKKRVSAQAANESATKKPRGSSTPNPTSSRKSAIFDVALISGQQMQSVALGGNADVLNVCSGVTMDLNYPLVFTSGNWNRLMKDAIIEPLMTQFQTTWMSSQIRVSSGRAALKMNEPASSLARDIISVPVRQLVCQLPQDDKYNAVRASIAPVLFAAACGSEHTYVEKDGCASLRLATRGFREVVMLTAQVLASIVAPGVDTKNQSLSQCCAGLLTASQAAIQVAAKDIRFATVGPNDLLYTPPGWIVAERIHNAANKNGDAP